MRDSIAREQVATLLFLAGYDCEATNLLVMQMGN